MYRALIAALLAMLLIFCAGKPPPGDSENLSAVIPQAYPVVALLKAAQEDNLELYKVIYSTNMRSLFQEEDWSPSLSRYAQLFEREFGDYALGDFRYSFSGDEDAGEVSILFQGRELRGLKVVREGEQWKLDER